MQKEEKKVEYLELIYDLIFVYIIGRNNSLMHHIENGFVSGWTFLTYLLCTLAIIQIWKFSTFYINRFGKNGVREHVFLFINMYLLYYMAEGTRTAWQDYFNQYNIAWALILINIGVQYLIELREHREAPWEVAPIKRTVAILFGEAAIILIGLPIYHATGVSIALIPILFGIIATGLSTGINRLLSTDFAHLSERAMLYVVFTFGEMIIAIAAYFEGAFNLSAVYFSLMAFLIVVGLFLSYGILYNRILDREKETVGTGYMMIHVVLIFALNNITTALEFMREEEVALWPKTLFLIGSFLLYFVFLFLTGRYAKKRLDFSRRFRWLLFGIAASFVALMLLFRTRMYLNIAITVLYIFGIFLMMYRFSEAVKKELPAEEGE